MSNTVDSESKTESNATSDLPNVDRRRVVKTIVGGVTAIASYNMLPAKWGTPIIEQIFLPAHAATSAGYVIESLNVKYTIGDASTSSVTVKISGQVSPPVAGTPVNLTITPVI